MQRTCRPVSARRLSGKLTTLFDKKNLDGIQKRNVIYLWCSIEALPKKINVFELEMAVIYEFSKLGKRGRKSRAVGDRIVSSYQLNRHLGTLEKHFH